MKLRERVCVVTGGVQGIGRAIVEEYVAHGARPAILDLNGDAATQYADELRARGVDARGYRCDVSSREDVAAAASAVERDLGRCQVLVNNAVLLGSIETSYAQTCEGNNVTKGKTVSAKGIFFTNWSGKGLVVDYSTLVDGVFFEIWHQWDQGPIWWDEGSDDIQNVLTVHLGGIYEVCQLRIQVDNNDDYKISWEDLVFGPKEVTVIPERNTGMAPCNY